MAKQPFSAPKPRSLPTYIPSVDIDQTLANWQAQIQPLIQNVAPQATPQNFGVTNSRGGLKLSWSPVKGADGYEILRSASGSFTDDLQVIPVKDANQSSFFDSTGGNAQTVHYRIQTTSGTAANPQSQRGPASGPVRHTSIDAADTKSVPVTVFDTVTTDATRSNARLGNYGAIKVSPLGQAGGKGVGSGTKSGSGASAGTPATGSTSPGSIGSGTLTNANISVGSGSSISPDPNNPGTVNANELQGIPVTSTTPTTGQLLQFNGTTLAYASIIAVGTQAGLPAVLPLGLGEIYVASDTGNLFVGTPGIGVGYLQVGDTSQMNETLLKMLKELRAMRAALTQLACDGGKATARDFDPQVLDSDTDALNS